MVRLSSRMALSTTSWTRWPTLRAALMLAALRLGGVPRVGPALKLVAALQMLGPVLTAGAAALMPAVLRLVATLQMLGPALIAGAAAQMPAALRLVATLQMRGPVLTDGAAALMTSALSLVAALQMFGAAAQMPAALTAGSGTMSATLARALARAGSTVAVHGMAVAQAAKSMRAAQGLQILLARRSSSHMTSPTTGRVRTISTHG